MEKVIKSAAKRAKYNKILRILNDWTNEVPESCVLARNKRYYNEVDPNSIPVTSYIGMTETLIEEYNEDRNAYYAGLYWEKHQDEKQQLDAKLNELRTEYMNLQTTDDDLYMAQKNYTELVDNRLGNYFKIFKTAASIFFTIDDVCLVSIECDNTGSFIFGTKDLNRLGDVEDITTIINEANLRSELISSVINQPEAIKVFIDAVKKHFSTLKKYKMEISRIELRLENPENISQKVF